MGMTARPDLSKAVYIRLPHDMHSRLLAQAHSEDRSVASVARRLLQSALATESARG